MSGFPQRKRRLLNGYINNVFFPAMRGRVKQNLPHLHQQGSDYQSLLPVSSVSYRMLYILINDTHSFHHAVPHRAGSNRALMRQSELSVWSVRPTRLEPIPLPLGFRFLLSAFTFCIGCFHLPVFGLTLSIPLAICINFSCTSAVFLHLYYDYSK